MDVCRQLYSRTIDNLTNRLSRLVDAESIQLNFLVTLMCCWNFDVVVVVAPAASNCC